ncbi:hypothetical protein CesoFtcFv8_010976 [Champsocephalus esox]|uniref:CD11B n=1 Tax=Champsocephalus esox TaxID=159716 RepID=A0AAN8BZI2_9TELE|nr:hypothetical protein CesoFtcFv8_010976 [Champsocephalus esox]
MGDEKETWKVKTLDEILQEKKRRRELEEKTDPKHQKNSSQGLVPQSDDRETKRDTPEEGELRDQKMEITIRNSPYTREDSTEDRAEEDDSLAIKPPQQIARKDKSHHRKEEKRKEKRRHRSHSAEGAGKHVRPKEKEKERESDRRNRQWEEDKARRDWERQKRREQARAHSRRESQTAVSNEELKPLSNLSLIPSDSIDKKRPRLDSPGFFLDHRDRLEQQERQRERDRKLRELQKEQRELKERERRAEERRKERGGRREVPPAHRLLPEDYDDKSKQSHRSRSPPPRSPGQIRSQRTQEEWNFPDIIIVVVSYACSL